LRWQRASDLGDSQKVARGIRFSGAPCPRLADYVAGMKLAGGAIVGQKGARVGYPLQAYVGPVKAFADLISVSSWRLAGHRTVSVQTASFLPADPDSGTGEITIINEVGIAPALVPEAPTWIMLIGGSVLLSIGRMLRVTALRH